ncbi:MAG: hypothetical protein R3213_04385 [Flavobacteriaceae bacterium]|nr:hypothetical protein [Flavobacteriaceae bacterium]
MKRLFVVLYIGLLTVGCSVDSASNEPAYQTMFMPISEVELPESFVFGQSYNIKVYYNVPSNCYSFSNFFFQDEDNIKTIAVINSVLTNVMCETYTNVTDVASFDLRIDRNESYIFKFWKGKNVNGEDDYYVVEVPVRR